MKKNLNDKFKIMTSLLKAQHQVIDTDTLEEVQSEIINITDFGVFKNNMTVTIVLLEKGMDRPPHIHHKTNAQFYFLSGKGTLMIDGKMVPYTQGSVEYAAKGVPHGFIVEDSGLMLSLQDNGGIIQADGTIDFTYKTD